MSGNAAFILIMGLGGVLSVYLKDKADWATISDGYNPMLIMLPTILIATVVRALMGQRDR